MFSYSSIPEEEYMAALREAGVPEWNVNMLVSLTRVIKLGMAGNVTKALNILPELLRGLSATCRRERVGLEVAMPRSRGRMNCCGSSAR